MTEIYLSEDDEEALKSKAVDNVLLAVIVNFVRQSADAEKCLIDLEATALNIASQGNHSADLATNEYARNLVASITREFLAQVKTS